MTISMAGAAMTGVCLRTSQPSACACHCQCRCAISNRAIPIANPARGARRTVPRRFQTAAALVTGAPQTQAGLEPVPPAVLPGTPKSFPIPADELIAKAKQLEATFGGALDDSLLAPDFRFEFPVVSLAREDYLKAVRSFNLKGAFPNLSTNAYDFRVDKYEPNRVWFTTRFTGTHTGPLKFGNSEYPATGRTVQSAPEAISYVFNEQGLCTSYTGGYQMDRRCGNTNNLGAIFGVLSAIGVPVPMPGTIGFTIAQTVNKVQTALASILPK